MEVADTKSGLCQVLANPVTYIRIVKVLSLL